MISVRIAGSEFADSASLCFELIDFIYNKRFKK